VHQCSITQVGGTRNKCPQHEELCVSLHVYVCLLSFLFYLLSRSLSPHTHVHASIEIEAKEQQVRSILQDLAREPAGTGAHTPASLRAQNGGGEGVSDSEEEVCQGLEFRVKGLARCF